MGNLTTAVKYGYIVSMVQQFLKSLAYGALGDE